MTSLSSEELAQLLMPLRNPLTFAARNDFENVERIKDLEKTLIAAATRLTAVVRDGGAKQRLATILRVLEAPGARKEKVRRVLEEVEAIAEGRKPKAEGREAIAESRAPKAESRRAKADVLTLASEVQYVRGVGPGIAKLLNDKGLSTVEDLLRFLPRRYEDRSLRGSIRDLTVGEGATVQGTILAKSAKNFRGRRSLEVAIGDESGTLRLTWFRSLGADWAERFQKGKRVQVSGIVKSFRGQLQMAHPETRIIEDDAPLPDAPTELVPIYSEIEGLRPQQLRRVIDNVLPLAEQLSDCIPSAIAERHRLPGLGESVSFLHRPPKETAVTDLLDMATPWHRRLIYEELFLLQLVVLQRKAQAAAEPGRAVTFPATLADEAKQLFPFALTKAQSRVLRELEQDMARPLPMHRLLQGDVGSGKTAVAMSAAAAIAHAGMQVAIMAPTELLAEQHARTALTSLPKAGVRVDVLTGSVSASERRRILGQLASGHIQVVVGTHALIQADVRFNKLALGIIDEQHRFGVLQRARILEQGRESLGATPHVLVMTATPIPRTLALTVYGDLDVSIIDELPPGRTPVKTVLFREKQREQVHRRIRHAVEQGRQAYVVFPLVEESDKEGMADVRAVTSEAEELANGALHGLRLGVLHGRLDATAKEQVMRAFLNKQIDVLVATTVVEVGIDVPNATVMVIEHAERFGLSQLHQLRGRVGRGAHASECLLVTSGTSSDDGWRRLGVMEETADGFKIAEADLEIRGPGDFIGTRQSGLPLLSLANLARDQKILAAARQDAQALLAADPALRRPEHTRLREALEARWHQKLELAQIG
ncbi:MAG: ATP-dependent DNA helicase RecG [Myxococcota bacterium]